MAVSDADLGGGLRAAEERQFHFVGPRKTAVLETRRLRAACRLRLGRAAEMCSGSEEGSYVRLIDVCIT